jgi:hypothetical protein
VPGVLNEGKPVAIVDFAPGPDLFGENLERDLTQALSPQHRIELVDPQLVGQPENALKLKEKALVAGNLLLEPLNQRAQTLHLRTLLNDPAAHHSVLREHRLGGGAARQSSFLTHGADPRRAGGRFLKRSRDDRAARTRSAATVASMAMVRIPARCRTCEQDLLLRIGIAPAREMRIRCQCPNPNCGVALRMRLDVADPERTRFSSEDVAETAGDDPTADALTLVLYTDLPIHRSLLGRPHDEPASAFIHMFGLWG